MHCPLDISLRLKTVQSIQVPGLLLTVLVSIVRSVTKKNRETLAWEYRVVTSARSCNKVVHLFWFTILAQHETDDVILYIHSVHKHRGNSFKLQNYKMRLKQIRLNWINSMQVKKILFTNVFFSWSLCLLNMFYKMVFP
jgi:hypothetical protein